MRQRAQSTTKLQALLLKMMNRVPMPRSIRTVSRTPWNRFTRTQLPALSSGNWQMPHNHIAADARHPACFPGCTQPVTVARVVNSRDADLASLDNPVHVARSAHTPNSGARASEVLRRDALAGGDEGRGVHHPHLALRAIGRYSEITALPYAPRSTHRRLDVRIWASTERVP